MNSTVENLQAIIEFARTLNFYVTAYISSDLKDDFEVFIFGFYFKIQSNKIEQIEFIEVEELESTERGEGGFGHTGK